MEVQDSSTTNPAFKLSRAQEHFANVACVSRDSSVAKLLSQLPQMSFRWPADQFTVLA